MICVIRANKDHGCLKNKGAIMKENIRKVTDYLLGDDFKKLIKGIIEEKAETLIEDDDEQKYTYYDPNPYDVEPQLIGSSGGWFVSDEGKELAYKDAKEQLLYSDYIYEIDEFPDDIFEFLDTCSEESQEWCYNIITNVIRRL